MNYQSFGFWQKKKMEAPVGAPFAFIGVLFNDADEEFHEVMKKAPHWPCYIEVDKDGNIHRVNADWEALQWGGMELVGLPDCDLTPENIVGAKWNKEKGEIVFADSADLLRPLSAKQVRLWLLQKGSLDKVGQIIADFKSPLREQAEIEWQYSAYFERNSDFIKNLAATLGWNDSWLNEEWRKALDL